MNESGKLPTFSVVVPVFNEEESIAELHRRLSLVMETLGAWEAIYVNDGSRDRSLSILEQLCRDDPRVGVVNLSRNFGKEVATTAGLDYARGEAVIVIDADLQDPPEVIPELVTAWREGWDIAYAQRSARDGETWLKKTTASLFYRLMARVGRVEIPRDTGDFRLLSRRVVDALGQLREHHRFMKGLFAWVGFPSKAIIYHRVDRFAGRGKWSYWKLWNLAIEGITSFTDIPLRIATYLGVGIACVSALYALEVMIKTLIFGNRVAGYPSLMIVVLFLGGVQLITIGVMGEYLGRVFNEVKRRPLYLVERYQPARSPSQQSGDLAAQDP